MTKYSYNYSFDFEIDSELDEEQQYELTTSAFEHFMGFMDFNNIKVNKVNDSLKKLSDNVEDASESTELAKTKQDFIQSEKTPWFQCDNCEEEFENECFFDNGKIKICRKCYKEYYD